MGGVGGGLGLEEKGISEVGEWGRGGEGKVVRVVSRG